MYMDDIKLFVQNEKELKTQILGVRTFSDDVGIEFGIEKCSMLIMKSGKPQMTEEIELPNQDKIRTFEEKKTCQIFGNIRSRHHQTRGDKRKKY